MGSNGALLSSEESRSRWLETQVRVGSYDLDNTHKVGNSGPAQGSYGTAVPVDDAPEVLRRAMWLETDKQYRAASEGLIKINTSKEVQAQTAEEHAPDFSREQPHVFYGPEVSIHPDRKPWEEKVRLYTRAFRASPQILNSIVTFSARATISTRSPAKARACSSARSTTGWNCSFRARRRMAWTSTAITILTGPIPPTRRTTRPCLPQGQVLRKELEALVAAPLVEPYAGPALLTGRATAVFFHEVFGHRAEGFRQKDINEGQTFARKVGEQILPNFLSIYDDPTEKTTRQGHAARLLPVRR